MRMNGVIRVHSRLTVMVMLAYKPVVCKQVI